MVRHCVPFEQVIFKWGQVKTEITCPLGKWIFFPTLKLYSNYSQISIKKKRIYYREFKAKSCKFKVAQNFLPEVNLDSF